MPNVNEDILKLAVEAFRFYNGYYGSYYKNEVLDAAGFLSKESKAYLHELMKYLPGQEPCPNNNINGWHVANADDICIWCNKEYEINWNSSLNFQQASEKQISSSHE